MYTIYEIPGVKIGCTNQRVQERIKKQGYSNYNILEEHTCIYEASNREQELQVEKGYPKDKVPYHITFSNSTVGGKKGGLKGGGHQRKLTMNDADAIRILYATGKFTQKDLGQRYGVSMRRISDIVNFKSYRPS